MAPGRPEQVPRWLMRLMGDVVQPMNDLDLRFSLIWAHLLLVIRAHVFEGLWALGHSCSTLVQ